MGARQSKRSVDITTTPKKDGLPAEGGVAGDAGAPGDGKLERIEESDGKPTTNGTAPHAEVAVIDEKDKDKEQEKEKDKDKDEDTEKEEVKVEDTRPESNTEAPVEAEEVTTPTDGVTPTSPESATSPDSKDAKKKDKKKKWSFRSLSFGKRDRSKTAREDAPKNGDVTKEEPLAEGGEEAEAAVPVEESSAEEKTGVSSPTIESAPASAEVKEDDKAAPASPTPVEEKKKEPTPAPTPVPVEEKKEEIEKVESVVAEKEVSPVQAIAAPIGATRAQPIATPSIIERKTSEDLPPPLPSSPPPTPIDPSPLQQAQHAAANASALAEALKVPAEAASMASQIATELVEPVQSVDDSKTIVATESNTVESNTVESNIVESNLASESLPVATTDSPKETETNLLAEAAQSISVPVEECVIVSEIVKSVESVPEEIPESLIENAISEEIASLPKSVEELAVSLESEPQNIVENGVSGLDSASSEALNKIVTEKIEPIIAAQESELQKTGDLVIQSEEGPLPLSEESLVEATPRHVVSVDDFVDSLVKEDEIINLENSIESQGIVAESKTVDVVEISADKISEISPTPESVLPDTEFVLLEKTEVNAPEVTTVYEKQVLNELGTPTIIDSAEDAVPPLPESPIPSFEKSQDIGELLTEKINDSADLINGLTEVVAAMSMNTNDLIGNFESEVVFDPIEEIRACHMSAEVLISPAKDSLQELSSSVTDILNESDSSLPSEKLASPKNELLSELSTCPLPAKDISDVSNDLPAPPNEVSNGNVEPLICSLPTKNLSNPADNILEQPILCPVIPKAPSDPESIVENGNSIEEILALKKPSPANLLLSQKESSQTQLIDDQSNQEFEVESLSQSLNSYNDSDVQLKERLAESEGVNGVENGPSCPLLSAATTAVPENAQKTPEPEALAENPAEISTTESVNEVPASPAPAVPAEIPILPPSEPAITEDVASVTKAIEEIDISDKAVAAAVNEAIESANTNELVTDSVHQNNIMNE